MRNEQYKYSRTHYEEGTIESNISMFMTRSEEERRRIFLFFFLIEESSRTTESRFPKAELRRHGRTGIWPGSRMFHVEVHHEQITCLLQDGKAGLRKNICLRFSSSKRSRGKKMDLVDYKRKLLDLLKENDDDDGEIN